MAASYASCPKCGHAPEQAIGAMEACPTCGVYMHKWRQIQEATVEVESVAAQPALRKRTLDNSRLEPSQQWGDEPPATWREMFLPPYNWHHLKTVDEIELSVRALVLLLLAWWGWGIARADLAEGEMSGDFMHLITLTIHEAGHVIFIPFGEFMTIAGGSIFQVFLPFAIAVAFFVKNRDPFGAAVCLWWTGMSIIDLAPYIYDALNPQLILLGGHTGEDGPHDWIYLFEELGGLQHSQRYGRAVHSFGMLVGLLAWIWGALVVWFAWQRHRNPSDD
jgi:hypothetical protein